MTDDSPMRHSRDLDKLLNELLATTSGACPSIERATDALLMAATTDRPDVKRRLIRHALNDVFELAVVTASGRGL